MAPKRKRGAAQTTGGTKKGKQQGGKDRLEREQEEHEVPRPGDAESDSGSPAAGRGADSAAESSRSAGQNGSADREHPPARSRAAAAKPRAASEGDCGVSGGQPASEAFRVIAGSYERLLYGLDARWTPETGCGGGGGGGAQKLKLAPVFIYPSHVGCIKTVAVGGKFLASGSSDEVIRLYDLRRRKELGVLMQHKGAITALNFHGKTHMLSAGEDGTISIWRTSDWECLKTMKGHLGRVNDLAIHPTGKIALSVGSDKTLRLWNLMNGRKVMATNLNQEGEYVRFSPSGTRYAVCSNKTVDIYSAADAKVSLSITAPNRVCSIAVHQAEDGKEYLVSAGEDRNVTVWDMDSGDTVAVFTGHPNRVKAIVTMRTRHPGAPAGWTTVLVSVSSDGEVKVWDLDAAISAAIALASPLKVLEPLGAYDTKVRLVCVTAAPGPEVQATSLADSPEPA